MLQYANKLSPAESVAVDRKLLIITTTFFPDPSVAAIRMTQWCKHLPEYGWQPHVLCRYYGFEATSEELATQVHPAVSVTYLEKPEAGRRSPVFKFGKGLSQWPLGVPLIGGAATLAVPDVSVYAWRRLRPQILAHVERIRPDAFVTTSPPHSIHDIGAWLTKETGIPWVADFRDPYLLDVRFRPMGLGRLRWKAHDRFKNLVYGRARLVTHAIPMQARWGQRFIPDSRERIRVLTNAFPSELLDDAKQSEAVTNERKTILVAGTIPELEQIQLAKAVALVAHDGHDVELKLIGKIQSCAPRLRELLGERVALPGYLSHRKTVRAIAEADVLVNFLDAFRRGTLLLSTKLLEYLATGKPVISINSSRSDRQLLGHRAGVSVLRDPTTADIAAEIRQALAQPAKRDANELDEYRANYNWDVRVAQLAEWLSQIVEFPPRTKSFAKPAAPPVASVVVPTRNRKELLGQCLSSALAQNVPVEVIVMDDGSTDGTPEMIRERFPTVRLFQLGCEMGPSFQRNRGIELATTPIVFPVDDDSIFSTPNVVEQTLSSFDHPRIAAVGIPFLNPRLNWTRHQSVLSNGVPMITHAFVGAAHAIRRDVFLQAGGYREHFYYMGEEGDLCLRLLRAGFVVRLGSSDPIFHMESPHRNLALADFCGRCNDVLFAWHNVPTAMLPVHLLGTTLNSLRAGVGTGHLLRMIWGTMYGFMGCWRYRQERSPVPAEVYWIHRRLKTLGSLSLEEVERHLPPLPSDQGATSIT